MLYAILIDGAIARVVDSPTDLDRLPRGHVERMCRDLGIPWRTASGDAPRVAAIRPSLVVRWDVGAGTPRGRRKHRKQVVVPWA